MKYVLFVIMTIAATLNLGCDNKLFQYDVSVDQTGQFIIDDADGIYTTSTFISRTSVAKAFNLPDGARVTSLQIESLSLKVVTGAGNAATDVTISGYLGTSPTTTQTLFNRVSVPLGGLDIPFIGLNSLIESNIGKLRTELENFVKGVGTGSLIQLAVSGTTTPAGSRLVLTINMSIKATVHYERCEEILKGMSDGPACAEGEVAH
ncbi:MAG: hypothetical protein ABI623_02885 [bacterium]